jgi:hypothetical protein
VKIKGNYEEIINDGDQRQKKKISGDYTVLTMRSAVYNNIIIERKRNHK